MLVGKMCESTSAERRLLSRSPVFASAPDYTRTVYEYRHIYTYMRVLIYSADVSLLDSEAYSQLARSWLTYFFSPSR